jgi:ketosteroid isomerase-like protein
MSVNELLVDGERACALTHYDLRPPVGNPFVSDVAEIFTVKNGKITSFAIYFDTAPFPSPGASKK